MITNMLSAPARRVSIFCALALAFALPGAASAGERQQQASVQPAKQSQAIVPPGHLRLGRTPDGTSTILLWDGAIVPPMAQQLQQAIDRFKDKSQRFLLVLNSPGGSVTEGERVITLLRKLKETHRFDTAVHAGKMCGSMCPFLYLQGQQRLAAPASLWLFHEVSQFDPKTRKPIRLDRQRWFDLMDKYFVPAGVSPDWIEETKATAKNRDYFVTGDSLISKHAGFITKTMADTVYRNVPSRPQS